MKLLKGKKLAEDILNGLKEEIEKNNLKLKLAVVLVGEDSGSKLFTRQKEKACQKIGIDFELFKFSAEISFDELKNEVEKICQSPLNSGVVIQLPLPEKLKEEDQKILNLVPYQKDIDVLSEENLGKFYSGTLSVLPPVVGAIFHLLKKYKISIKGKNVVLVGAGRLVGFPLAIWFLKERATVSVINKFTKNISSFMKKADIIISGVGKAEIIKGSMVKRGVVIIDAGISFKNGKLSGDVDFKTVFKKAGYITPVPGGVGPMTVACLIENLIRFNKK